MLKLEVDIYIGLIPATIPPITNVHVVDCWHHHNILFFLMVELDIGQITATLTPKDRLVGLMVQDVEVGMKRSVTLICSMLEKVLIVMLEVDIGLRPALLPPVIQVILVYHHVFIVMLMTEADKGFRPETLLHITMVN